MIMAFIALIFLQGCNSGYITTVSSPIVNASENYSINTITSTYVFPTATKYYPPNTPTPRPTQTPTPIPIPAPKWKIDTSKSNYALVILDYKTLQFKEAYYEDFKRCESYEIAKSDQELICQAMIAINLESSLYSFQRVGNFALLEICPGGIGGIVMFESCTGQALFVGTVVRMGLGDQSYPVHPIIPSAFEHETGSISQPDRFDAIANPESTDLEGFELAWNSVQTLNLVRDFSRYHYEVFVYLYPPRVGVFSAPDAEWLIFLNGPVQ